jgi:hypothetical protein
VSFVDQLNKGMQQIMLLRTPEVMERLPEVEAMPWEARVAYAQRGYDNVDAIIKSWDKFAGILAAQGMDRAEIKRRAKGFKSARGNLDRAMRLTDKSKIPPPFHDKVETAFNTLVAWFKDNMGYLESVITGPRITKSNVSALELPPLPADAISADHGDEEEMTGPDLGDEVIDGPQDARPIEGDSIDLIERSGGERVHL